MTQLPIQPLQSTPVKITKVTLLSGRVVDVPEGKAVYDKAAVLKKGEDLWSLKLQNAGYKADIPDVSKPPIENPLPIEEEPIK